jgi:hypothetical protein
MNTPSTANNGTQERGAHSGMFSHPDTIASIWCAGGFVFPFAMFGLILMFGRGNPPALSEKESLIGHLTFVAEKVIDVLFVMHIILMFVVLWICRKRFANVVIVTVTSLAQFVFAAVFWVVSRFAMSGFWL